MSPLDQAAKSEKKSPEKAILKKTINSIYLLSFMTVLLTLIGGVNVGHNDLYVENRQFKFCTIF